MKTNEKIDKIPLYELMQVMARTLKDHYRNQRNVEITVSNEVFTKIVWELRTAKTIDEYYTPIGNAKSLTFPIKGYEGSFILKKALPLHTNEDVNL